MPGHSGSKTCFFLQTLQWSGAKSPPGKCLVFFHRIKRSHVSIYIWNLFVSSGASLQKEWMTGEIKPKIRGTFFPLQPWLYSCWRKGCLQTGKAGSEVNTIAKLSTAHVRPWSLILGWEGKVWQSLRGVSCSDHTISGLDFNSTLQKTSCLGPKNSVGGSLWLGIYPSPFCPPSFTNGK